MRLSSLSIYNLRSIKGIQAIDLSSGLDVFIGQNDSGKSTILYALDFFFNDRNCLFRDDQNNKNDLSFNGERHVIDEGMTIEPDEIGVICRFQLSEVDLAQSGSELAKLCNGGVLSVLKKCCLDSRFDPATGRGGKKPTAYFSLTDSFDKEEFNNLAQVGESELIQLMDKYSIPKESVVNRNNVGKPENVERVESLLKYARLHEKSTATFVKLSFSPHQDPVWPEFSLIDTKTSLDGKHKIIEDAFKKLDAKIESKHKPAIDEMKKDTKTEYDQITEKIRDYAKKNYIPQIEEFSAQPIVKLSVGRDLIMKRVGQKDSSHFDLQGDGTKRRMMVAILQTSATIIKELSQAESRNEDPSSTSVEYVPLKIWAFDEPELHLHPGAQRDLYNSFRNFQSEGGFQVICSTHSTTFVNNANLTSVHLISLNEDLETTEHVKDQNVDKIIRQSLGVKNSDIFYSNLTIVVEGATEQSAFPIIFQKLFGQDLASVGIVLIDGGGWTGSKERVDFLIENLVDAICLFDMDVKASLGNELNEYEDKHTVYFIGTADFEDAFDNEVWLKVLSSEFNVEAEGASIWSHEVLDTERGKIVSGLDDKNKKFLRLIENYYRKKCLEYNLDGEGHPLTFDKKEIGVKLATTAIELDRIPESMIAFVAAIRTKVHG